MSKFYVLDPDAAPGLVVLGTDDSAQASDVAQKYANQVQRPVVIASGTVVQPVLVAPTSVQVWPGGAPPLVEG